MTNIDPNAVFQSSNIQQQASADAAAAQSRVDAVAGHTAQPTSNDWHPGLSIFFNVTLDVVDLGHWTKVSGLGIELDTQARKDTSMNFFQHNLVAHLKYTNITLDRPVCADTSNVLNWISSYHMLPVPSSGAITVMRGAIGAEAEVLMSWQLYGVSPVSWKGPSLDAASANAAMESLTFAHMGFM
jgi:phage tail-like protein